MLEKINAIYNSLRLIIEHNQMLAAGLGVYGFGLVTYTFRDIPLMFIKFIKKQCTTTLTINSNDPVFYDFLKWVDNKTIIKLVRNWNFNNGKSLAYYLRLGPMMSIGYGRTYVIYNKKIIFIDRIKIEASQTIESKETITATILGRSNNIFKKIFKEIEILNKVIDNNEDLTSILVYTDDGWLKTNKIVKRSLESVILQKNTKKNILDHLDNFIKNKKWYEENGIPYRTGILLDGPPGTGKTSLVKAIAAYLNRPIFYLDAAQSNSMTIKKALENVPINSLILIEEIDRIFNPLSENKEENGVNMGTNLLLNSLDGIVGSENRIIIATTNHKEKLDPALIREGRFDLKIHIGYLDDETFQEYMKRFYPDFKQIYKYNVKKNIAPCLVQKLIFENKNDISSVLKEVAYIKENTQINISQEQKILINDNIASVLENK
jgi:mitochondrial chaperone BCS1